MGNNQNIPLKPDQAQTLKEKYCEEELRMLWKIYEDLSARDYGVINKETFLKFFPLTGLWGERLFEKFDLKHTTFLTFFEFAYGLSQCCKSSEEDKIKLLFSLYDFDNDGYIEKKEMITMLYNYPKNHIKFITDEIAPDNGEKLEQITEARREASMANLDAVDVNHIVPSSPPEMSIMQDNEVDEIKNAEDMEIANEDKKDDQLYPVDRDIRKSFKFHKTAEDKKRRESEISSLKTLSKNMLDPPKIGPTQKLQGNGKVNKPITMIDLDNVPQAKDRRKYSDAPLMKPNRAMSSAMNQISPLNPLRVNFSQKISGSTIIMDQSFVQSTTINTRIKEYASFMFKTFEGANSRGKISFSEFKEWLTMHPIILKIFDQTFHQEIWSSHKNNASFNFPTSNGEVASNSQLDRSEQSKINYQLMKPEIEGIMFKRGKKTKAWQSRYYELRGDFLFYYARRGASFPKGVHFLEGCYIEEINDYPQTHKYGFRITHKSASYEPHCFYVATKEQFDDWMNHLKSFRNTSIHDMYDFQEKIGTGKFSIVYRAVSKKDNTSEYAIKVIEKGGLKPEEREFVLSETTVMKVLNHPQVIKLIETIETKTTIYIVTELVKDGDLFEYIVTRDFLEEYESSFIMKQLLVAFHYLESVEIVHRDIKPENIMITLSEDKQRVKEIKIIDFGFAKFMTPGTKLVETCGTPNYVSPEVLKGVGYDKRTDIWGLGIIMYLMLRGRLPFDSHNVDEILRNTLRAEIPMDEEHWDNISADGKDLLLKLLQKDMNRRITIKEALRHPWITERERLKRKIGSNKRDFDPSSMNNTAPTGLDHGDP